MRANTAVCIFAVGALMAGVFGLFMTGQFMSGSADDPYDAERTYDVSGKWSGMDVSGTCSCTRFDENGAFHNYMFQMSVSDGDGAPRTLSFTVIFGPDDVPEIFSYSEDRTFGEDVLPVYSCTVDGTSYEIAVSEHCLVRWFHAISFEYDLQGFLKEGA